MVPTTEKESNPCKTLRGNIMILVVDFLRSNGEYFDEASLDALLEPLPEADQKKLRDHCLGIAECWHNFKVYGKKLSNTSINRRISRLGIACCKVEDDYAVIWNHEHQNAGCTR